MVNTEKEKPKRKNNGITKPTLEEWLTEERLQQVEEWCANGLSMKNLAHNIGIGYVNLYKWCNMSPEFKEAVVRGRDKSVDMVENALFQSAMSGNVTAIIFFLKNKRPKEYRDRQEVETNNTDKIEIKFDD